MVEQIVQDVEQEILDRFKNVIVNKTGISKGAIYPVIAPQYTEGQARKVVQLSLGGSSPSNYAEGGQHDGTIFVRLEVTITFWYQRHSDNPISGEPSFLADETFDVNSWVRSVMNLFTMTTLALLIEPVSWVNSTPVAWYDVDNLVARKDVTYACVYAIIRPTSLTADEFDVVKH